MGCVPCMCVLRDCGGLMLLSNRWKPDIEASLKVNYGEKPSMVRNQAQGKLHSRQVLWSYIILAPEIFTPL